MDHDHSIDPPRELGDWRVSRCECGRIVLRMGEARMEFGRDEFAQLHRLMSEAMREYQIAPSSSHVVRLGATTH